MTTVNDMDRRDFLRAGLAGSMLALTPLVPGQSPRGRAVALVADASDPVVAAPPVAWAIGELTRSLSDAGFTVQRFERVDQASSSELCIVAAGSASAPATAALRGVSPPATPESLALVPTRMAGGPALVACGADARGLMYALLEVADRVRFTTGNALTVDKVIVERPANAVRSVMRQFTSETLDKPWFNDREMWPHYLTMLASQRFNRLHLAFGLGYDFLQRVLDSYLVFLYPFLLAVPGYDVRATNLSDAERDRNLDTLRFISEETVKRGIDFQLGIWMHGYRLANSPDARYVIEGLTPATHAAYCRDALTTLLRACPAISSVALRIHGESGIAEGSYDFWKTIFDGVTRCGRRVEIDLHAKGVDATMIDNALATGMPVNVSPKYWAEHLGMPYHQAAIRDLEMPVEGRTGAGLMTLSEGARIFTRYGYADLLRDDRKYTVRHRVFSGTQRVLLSGDPEATKSYSRMFQFCGSSGVDLMEPLTCRGRRGTGLTGNRLGYVDERLAPRWDWEKYAYWYRVWGRLTYNPDTPPDVWRRPFGTGTTAQAVESALAQASRILPIVTTAHLPSAACDAYWPEVYWNQPMAAEAQPNPYGDTPAPKTFQHTSPLDPQLFARMSDVAAEWLAGDRSGKYTPVDVAQWLEDLAVGAEKDLALGGATDTPERKRLAIDVAMQVNLGRFFAAKFRAGVLYAIHERSGDRRALEEALTSYRAARRFWAALADRAKGVYAADLSASDKASERGQWLDRLPAIDQDIDQMARRLEGAKTSGHPRVAAAIVEALARPRREPANCTHQPPAGFRPKAAVSIELGIERGAPPASVRLHYRRVNQAERFESVEMEGRGSRRHAVIPAAYTDSPYSLQYYFELKKASGKAVLFPGFATDLLNQPYFVLRRI